MNNAMEQLAVLLARRASVFACSATLALTACATGESTFQDAQGELFAGLPESPSEAGAAGDLKAVAADGSFSFSAEPDTPTELRAEVAASSLLPPGDTLDLRLRTPLTPEVVHAINPAAAVVSSRAIQLATEAPMPLDEAIAQATQELLDELGFVVLDENAPEALRFDRAALTDGDTFRNRAMVAVSLAILLVQDENKQAGGAAQARLDALSDDFASDGEVDATLRDALIETLFQSDLIALEEELATAYEAVGVAPFPAFTETIDLDGDGHADDLSLARCGDGTVSAGEWSDPPAACGLVDSCEPAACTLPTDPDQNCVSALESAEFSKAVLQVEAMQLDGATVLVERDASGVQVATEPTPTPTELPTQRFVVATTNDVTGDALFAPNSEANAVFRWDLTDGVSEVELGLSQLPTGAIQCLGTADLNEDGADELLMVVEDGTSTLYAGFLPTDGTAPVFESFPLGSAGTCQQLDDLQGGRLLVTTTETLVVVELLTGNRLSLVSNFEDLPGTPAEVHTIRNEALMLIGERPFRLADDGVSYALTPIDSCLPTDGTLLGIVPLSSDSWAAVSSAGVTLLDVSSDDIRVGNTFSLEDVSRIVGGSASLNVVTMPADSTTGTLHAFELP